MQFYHYVILYYLLINLLAYILYGVDKQRAVQSAWRIPERSLLFMAFLGGGIGSALGMLLWHHKTRKTKFRVFVPVWLAVHIAMICFVTYQNNHLVVSKYHIHAGLNQRIVQISDLHNTSLWWNKDYIPERVRELEPDLIVITGDICDSNHTNIGNALYTAGELAKIADTYYITGNHEDWLSEGERQELMIGLADRGVHILSNEYVTIGDNKTDYLLIGLEDRNLGDHTLTELIAKINEDKENAVVDPDTPEVLLAHEPQYIAQYANAGVDCVLTGHTHGGQWILPGIGSVVAPDQGFFPDYSSGIVKQGTTTMIISRGIGNSVIPIRLFNYPEIVIVED